MGFVAPIAGLLGGGGGLGGILGIGFKVLGAVAGIAAQNQQADAEQARYDAEVAEQRRKEQEFIINRDKSLQLQENSLRLRQAQEQEAQARQRFQASRELAKARGTAQVSASAGGVGGVSIDSMLADFNLQTSFFTEASKKQDQYAAQDLQSQFTAAEQQRTSDISSTLTAPPPPPNLNRPSFATAALRIGGTFLSGLQS